MGKGDIPGFLSNPLNHGKFPVVEGGRVRSGQQRSWDLGVQAALMEDKNETFCRSQGGTILGWCAPLQVCNVFS